MDELALLRDFRLEDASADGAREYARAALQTAMTRRRLPRRRYALVLAFAVAALLAAAAYAIVHEFVIGTAAPKDLQDQVGLHIAIGNAGEPIPFAGGPHKASGPALIAAGAKTSIGDVFMLLTSLKGGGECQFVWYASERGPKGEPVTSGGCQFGPERRRAFGYGFEGGVARDGHPYQLIEGYAPGAIRIRIGNRFYKTPFGWFIAEYLRQDRLTAWGVHGGVVARVKLSPAGPKGPPPPARPTTPTVPTGPPHVIISTHTGWVQSDIHVTPAGKSFTWRLTHRRLRVSVAANNKGGRCIHVDVGSKTTATGPGCYPPLRANELNANPYPFGWTTKPGPGRQWVEDLALLGQVGANITRVEVRFSDRRSAVIPLHEGVIFYVIPRRNFAAGHRPVEVVGRNASGNVVARKRLPFAR